MKTKLHIILLALLMNGLMSGSFAQTIEEGFGVLKIDAPVADLKQYLVETPEKSMWATGRVKEVGKEVSSAWVFNHELAGLTTYHGLKIARIEVFFIYTEEKSASAEEQKLTSFKIYLQKPANDKANEEFIASLFKQYEETDEIVDSETRENLGYSWYGEQFFLSLSYTHDFDTGKKLDYYIMDYTRD